jgi:hypothetical protein
MVAGQEMSEYYSVDGSAVSVDGTAVSVDGNAGKCRR